MSSNANTRKFMVDFVEKQVRDALPQFVKPCSHSRTGQKLAVPDVSGPLLAEIRVRLAEHAENLNIPAEKFDESFTKYFAPVFNEVAPPLIERV